MAGHSPNVSSVLRCPHGGTVQITSSNAKTSAAGALMAGATDTFVVSGCPFQIPAVVPIPSPCVQVLWLVPDFRLRIVGGTPTLSKSDAGLCLSAAGIPQGPVTVDSTQTDVQSQ
jgi:hypothetical protein